MYLLSPSILGADYIRLGEEVKAVEKAGAQYIHLDVMDGCFVPSISFGMPVIAGLRKATKLIFDVHLMVEEPDRYLDDFARCGADIITVHQEACTHLHRTLQHIHALGKKAGVALNPATPIQNLECVLEETDMILIMSVNPGFGGQPYIPFTTDKIRSLKRFLKERGKIMDIQVDGGISLSNLEEVLEAGANVIVAGSSIFRGNAVENTQAFLEKMAAFEERQTV